MSTEELVHMLEEYLRQLEYEAQGVREFLEELREESEEGED